MLDLDEPVTVTFNGTALPPRQATRTLAVLRRTLTNAVIPACVFSAEITAVAVSPSRRARSK